MFLNILQPSASWYALTDSWGTFTAQDVETYWKADDAKDGGIKLQDSISRKL